MRAVATDPASLQNRKLDSVIIADNDRHERGGV